MTQPSFWSGSPGPDPKELRHWNWGAFGLTWIWGIAHKTPIAFLVFVPVVGWLTVPVLLGLRGNAWAWRNRSWASADAFRSSQRRWAWLACGSWAAALLATIALSHALFHIEAFQVAQTELQSHPRMFEIFGQPIEVGLPMGSVKVTGDTGEAQFQFSLSGPRANGTAHAVTRKKFGKWSLVAGTVELEDGGGVMEIHSTAEDTAAEAPR